MRRFIITCSFLVGGSIAKAADSPLTAKEIRSRLEIKGDVFIVDNSGKRLEFAPSHGSIWTSNSGKGVIESNWGSTWKFGHVYLHHVWTVNPDATISVVIEEYGREDENGIFSDLLKKSELTVENFAPITWKVLNGSHKGLIVRLTPDLKEVVAPKVVADLPVAARKITISDNRGYLWTEGGDFNDPYVGITTHRGTLALSYKPFKGAQEIGQALDNEIRLDLPDGLKVKIRSDSAFVPPTVAAKVYGIFLPDVQASGPRSTHTFTSSTEDSFLKHLERAAQKKS